MVANNLLHKRLNKTGYYDPKTRPGLWRHKCSPVMFVLIVDNFGIEYVGNSHLHHLRTVLTDHYKITEDLDGIKSSGIDLNCNYAKDHSQSTCRPSMYGYTTNLLLKFGHKSPTKTQLSLHLHHDIVYSSKQQLAVDEAKIHKLTEKGIKRVQVVVGVLLYYNRAVNNKLLTPPPHSTHRPLQNH